LSTHLYQETRRSPASALRPAGEILTEEAFLSSDP
jgi:hypothetical protein